MKDICIHCWWIFLLVSSQTSQEHIVTHAQDHNTALVHRSSFSYVFVLCLDWWGTSLPVGCLNAVLTILLNFTQYYLKPNNITQYYLNTSIKSLLPLTEVVICYTYGTLITCCCRRHFSILSPVTSHDHGVIGQMGWVWWSNESLDPMLLLVNSPQEKSMWLMHMLQMWTEAAGPCGVRWGLDPQFWSAVKRKCTSKELQINFGRTMIDHYKHENKLCDLNLINTVT